MYQNRLYSKTVCRRLTESGQESSLARVITVATGLLTVSVLKEERFQWDLKGGEGVSPTVSRQRGVCSSTVTLLLPLSFFWLS